MFARCREKWESEQRGLGHALHGHYRFHCWANNYNQEMISNLKAFVDALARYLTKFHQQLCLVLVLWRLLYSFNCPSERFEAEQEREYGDWKERLREREEQTATNQQQQQQQKQQQQQQQETGRSNEVKNMSLSLTIFGLDISWGCGVKQNASNSHFCKHI